MPDRISTPVLVAAARALATNGDPNGMLPLVLDLIAARNELAVTRAELARVVAATHGGHEHAANGDARR